MLSDLCIMPERHDWNRLGYRIFPIPLWFQLRLQDLDPTLQMQYIPPTNIDIRGMSETQYPYGGWQVCRKLKRSGWLHKLAVYTLMDRYGRYVPPTPGMLKLIRYAKGLWNHREFGKMQKQMDDSIVAINRGREDEAKDVLNNAMNKFLSFQGKRQFHNRVFNADSYTRAELN